MGGDISPRVKIFVNLNADCTLWLCLFVCFKLTNADSSRSSNVAIVFSNYSELHDFINILKVCSAWFA